MADLDFTFPDPLTDAAVDACLALDLPSNASFLLTKRASCGLWVTPLDMSADAYTQGMKALCAAGLVDRAWRPRWRRVCATASAYRNVLDAFFGMGSMEGGSA